jgi:ribosomal protein L35
MHVATTSRHYTTKAGEHRRYETHLVRRADCDRKTGNVKNETLANLSHLPAKTVSAFQRSLAGEALVSSDDVFEVVRSRGHGHVAATAAIAEQLGLPQLLAPAGRERDICYALLLARVVPAGLEACHHLLVGRDHLGSGLRARRGGHR